MAYHLVALLDRPDERSFGIVPLLCREEGTGEHLVYGLAKGTTPLVLPSMMSVEDFVQMNCRDVDACAITFDEEPHGKVAAWFGEAFLRECRAVDVPVPELPNGGFPHRDAKDAECGGHVWVAAYPDAYARLDGWFRTAARICGARRDARLARLMRWCFPQRVETHAMLWYTTENRSDADRELRWFLRVYYRDKKWTARKLRRHLMKEVERLHMP